LKIKPDSNAHNILLNIQIELLYETSSNTRNRNSSNAKGAPWQP
jgi:hypothetical protein